MKIFIDTEFDEEQSHDPRLISIGMIREDGQKYYAQDETYLPYMDSAHGFLKSEVLPQLDGQSWKSRAQIAQDIQHFVGRLDYPTFWGYYADYDWYLFCRLYGGLLNVPPGWPHICLDVKQLHIERGSPTILEPKLPKHHPLNDAIWTKDMYYYLDKLRRV